jgi:AmmeMemoRadiSam system protein A
MPIVYACVLPHPPLAVPAVGRGEERKIHETLDAYNRVSMKIAALAPDTIAFMTPHNVLYADYFHISPGSEAKGSLARFNAPDVQIKIKYDNQLADTLIGISEINALPVGYLGDKDRVLDHGVMVPMWFINRQYNDYKILRISQSGLPPSAHYTLGKCIAEAAEESRRRVVFIASGDLSHKLRGSSYGVDPEGAEYDQRITGILKTANFLSLFNIPDDLRERAAECGHNSIMTLAGCFDRRAVDAKLLSYEGPFGVGYAVAGFSPGERDESRDYLDQYVKIALKTAGESQKSEDPYRSLARQSLEYTVKTGRALPLPEGLPEQLLNSRAGVFVSLHREGRLRGCIGTITPAAENVAMEIIKNAVSAGLSDSRFEPVKASDLPLLTYKVDVLSAPEPISGPEDLDVRRYGVIVSSGYKRGLLLPNLEGVDTVEEQLSIARRKGGIAYDAPVKLERFEVIRHE